MAITDPVADMLTRIRNALLARHEVVEIPISAMKLRVAEILKEEGFIRDFTVVPTVPQGTLRIELKYTEGRKSAILGLRRVSKPGRRMYYSAHDLPKVRNGLGVGIVSTNRGVLTDSQARKMNVGGEYLCVVW